MMGSKEKAKGRELRPCQIEFIESKVRALGSKQAVYEFYRKRDRVGVFARAFARYLYR